MSVQVGAGNHYSLFFKDGVVYSVGENNEAQLGRGTQTATGVAWGDVGTVNIPEGFTGEIVSISAGQLHGAFLTAAGEIYTWGDNNLGKLGLGTTSNYELLVPTKVTALDGVVISSIIMANGASYAISDTGVLYSWGQNTNGQLGIGSLINTGTPTAINPTAFGGEKVVEVSSGTSFTLVRTESGEVYAMGGNVQGQLGKGDSGTATRSNVPVKVDVPGTVVKVVAGTNTSLAITDDGKVWGWGQTDFGQLIKGEIVNGILTNPNNSNVLLPSEIQGLPGDVVDAHIGSRWGIALTASGEVWAWGRNDEGWLGIETATGELSTLIAPTKLPGFDGIKIVSIEGGPNHSLAVDADGNIYGWGNMNQGRLGSDQGAGVWASGPVLIPLEDDGRTMLVDKTDGGSDLVAGALPDGKTGFSMYGFGGTDKIVGSDGSDYINGGSGNDTLEGGAGNDTLIGGVGDDALDGGEGSDLLKGGSGDDSLTGGAGDDILIGGAGTDTAVYGGNQADYRVQLSSDGKTVTVTDIRDGGVDGIDTLTEIEKLSFADGTIDAPVNQAPTSLALSAAYVFENKPADTLVGDLSAVDPEGGALTYVLTDSAGGLFRLDGTSLLTTASFDYDAAQSYSITVEVTDLAGATTSQTFVIDIRDTVVVPPANSAPTVNNAIADQAAVANTPFTFAFAGNVFADADGDTLTYSIGTKPAWLVFNSATRTFSGTPGAGDEGLTSITVTASDGRGGVVSDTFDIIVTAPASEPGQILLSHDSVAENSRANTVVGALSGENLGDGVTYTLVANEDSAFAIRNGKLVVAGDAKLDFEKKTSYELTVRATNAEGETFDETFTIGIDDVAEGTKGNDLVRGDAGDNILDGGAGNDRLRGGDGADTFVFRGKFGHDKVLDFDASEGDVIDLSGARGIKNFGDLMRNHAEQTDNGVLITADNGATVLLKHVDLDDLSADSFLF